MKNSKQHIVVAKQKEAGRWYDNPDISDLMFAMLSMNDDYNNRAICLHTYDKVSGKGVSKVALAKDNQWQPTELVASLEKKIAYHPILTVSTKDDKMVRCMFDNILDGIDGVNGANGMPACIVVPVLMHYNHFGTMVIKPSKNKSDTEVYYFNPLGTLSGYADEERLMFSYMRARYGITDKQIVHNSNEQWQTDGNQCGPYAICFVEQIADLVLENKLNKEAIEERFKKVWKWGVDNQENTKTALDIRSNHADLLNNLNTNFTIPLFLSFKMAVLNNPKWHENIAELRFANPELQKEWRQQKHLKINYVELRDCAGVDTFEAQEETRALLMQKSVNLPSVHRIIEKTSDVPTHKTQPPQPSHLRYQVGCVLACAAAGALSAYVFNVSPDVSLLNKMASLATQSDATAAIIKNTGLGAVVGAILLVGYECIYGNGQSRE